MKQFLRLKQHLHRGRDISLCVLLNYWEEPALVLHRSREADIWTNPIIGTDSCIGQGSPARNKLLADLLMPKIELQTVARSKPIVCPGLGTLPFAADPTTNYISIVSIPTSPSTIKIIEAVTESAPERVIGVNTLCSQI